MASMISCKIVDIMLTTLLLSSILISETNFCIYTTTNTDSGLETLLAAYSAFGSYGSSYVHPQTPSSVAQTAAYGAYPSTYVAQQSYAPSSTAATLTTAQQPTSAPPQAYYGSNY
ncbi:unnamed protein product [Ilex paraguariensis]|uniref:Uncharacterized protein n=1 Tax=Ilex paraguariensis TaxID=185542 RepID=A0ABC8S922_9AQUA